MKEGERQIEKVTYTVQAVDRDHPQYSTISNKKQTIVELITDQKRYNVCQEATLTL